MTCTDTSILPLNDLPIQSILEFESPPIELISKFMEIIGVINGHLIDRRHIPIYAINIIIKSRLFSMGEEIPQIMVDPFESDNNFFKKFKPSDVEVNWITTFLDDHPRHQFEIPAQLDSPVNEDHKDALLLKALAAIRIRIQICPTDNVLISNNIIDIKRVVKAVNHDDLDLGHDDVELEVQGVHTKRPFSSSHYSLDKVAFDGLVHALYSHLFNQILVALQQSSLNQDPYQYLIQYFTLFNHSELTSKRNSKLHEIDQEQETAGTAISNTRTRTISKTEITSKQAENISPSNDLRMLESFHHELALASSSSSPSYIRPTLAPIDFNQHTRIAKRLKFDDDDDDKTIKLNTDQDFNCLSEPFLDDEHHDLPPRRTRSRIIHQSTYDPIIDFESSSRKRANTLGLKRVKAYTPIPLLRLSKCGIMTAKNRAPGRPPAPEEMMATASALGTISLYNPSYKGSLENQLPITTFQGIQNGIFALAFSGSDKILGTGSGAQISEIFDIETGNCLGDYRTIKALSNLISHDVITIKMLMMKNSSVRNVGKGLITLVSSVLWSRIRDHQLYSAGSSNGVVKLWDIRKKTPFSSKAHPLPLEETIDQTQTDFEESGENENPTNDHMKKEQESITRRIREIDLAEGFENYAKNPKINHLYSSKRSTSFAAPAESRPSRNSLNTRIRSDYQAPDSTRTIDFKPSSTDPTFTDTNLLRDAAQEENSRHHTLQDYLADRYVVRINELYAIIRKVEGNGFQSGTIGMFSHGDWVLFGVSGKKATSKYDPYIASQLID
ncbi:hypothetical protein KEM48_012459 [Puccinia striiformis f. sp. tritici PST-130]|nr:hypothetical protein KEM48_012459 [Puccinia striiformis f. sp. tritici PST-130]